MSNEEYRALFSYYDGMSDGWIKVAEKAKNRWEKYVDKPCFRQRFWYTINQSACHYAEKWLQKMIELSKTYYGY